MKSALAMGACLLLVGAMHGSTSQALDHWFQTGRCAAFAASYSPRTPFSRKDNEELRWVASMMPFLHSGATPSFIYDRKHGTAFRAIGGDSYGSRTWRFIGPPPVGVPRADMAALATSSGIRLATPATFVRKMLGAPLILHGCGKEQYRYMVDRQIGGNPLSFTISAGRVIEIFSTYGD